MKISLSHVALGAATAASVFFTCCTANHNQGVYSDCVEITADGTFCKLSKEELFDKIKGGWAGQTIGCSFGSVTEFRYQGTMIQDYVPIQWTDGYIKHFFDTWPQLYDDIYMDLTFVEVFNRLGLQAPADSFAVAFANAPYSLWHANQAARYNILRGIMPPESGSWLNNPHANDIDFQIEADFAGLMSPGMPNTASQICDKIGHIMNCGDGWYGGVYVAAMYALSFVSEDIEFIVREALKVIPEQSNFYECMADVLRWHVQFPDDWKQTWFECQRKWTSEVGCPEGVFAPLNIDAGINCAYVLIGLLYGDGDFGKTMEIATRCGQDSDCNPATAAGILGTIIGYDRIPDRWKRDLSEVEDINFCYTNISLNGTYESSFNHALQNIELNGGAIDGNMVTIKCQQPQSVQFEQAFEGMNPVAKIPINRKANDVGELTFRGNGVVVSGYVSSPDPNYVAEIEVTIDGKVVETVAMPASYRTRRLDIFWNYKLQQGDHTLSFIWINPAPDANITFQDMLVYSEQPFE